MNRGVIIGFAAGFALGVAGFGLSTIGSRARARAEGYRLTDAALQRAERAETMADFWRRTQTDPSCEAELFEAHRLARCCDTLRLQERGSE